MFCRKNSLLAFGIGFSLLTAVQSEVRITLDSAGGGLSEDAATLEDGGYTYLPPAYIASLGASSYDTLGGGFIVNTNNPNDLDFTTIDISPIGIGSSLPPDGSPPSYSVTISGTTFPPEGGVLTIEGTSNVPWNIWSNGESPDWLSVSFNFGFAGDFAEELTAEENPWGEPRSIELFVGTESFTVTQLGLPPVFSLSTPEEGFPTNSIEVETNHSWDVAGLPTWLSVSSSSGRGNETVVVSAESNEGAEPRSADFTIHGERVVVEQRGQTPLLGLSTRGWVGSGDRVLIGGFVIEGTGSKQLLMMGRGPSMPSFVPNRLENPTIDLYDGAGTLLVSNDDWSTGEQADAIAATTIGGPASSLDAAILWDLQPGAYTAIVRGKANSEGIGIFELYDLDPYGSAKLVNLSTRGRVGGGDNVLIGGITFGGSNGDTVTPVVVRGRGPSMPAEIEGRLYDPKLQIFDGASMVFEVDDWTTDLAATAFQYDYAHFRPDSPVESAFYRVFPAGKAYTTILRGANATEGVGIVEFFIER